MSETSPLRTQRRGTCQICAVDVALDRNGLASHHGYERPGHGWQTDSCPGARHLPFERSKKLLPGYIEQVESWKAGQERYLADLKEGRVAEFLVEVNQPLRVERVEGKKWEKVFADDVRYGQTLARAIVTTEVRIDAAATELARVRARLAAWTHAPERIRDVVLAMDAPETLGDAIRRLEAEGYIVVRTAHATDDSVPVKQKTRKDNTVLSGKKRGSNSFHSWQIDYAIATKPNPEVP